MSALGRRLEDFGGIHKYSVPSADTAGQECALLPLTLGGGTMCLGPCRRMSPHLGKHSLVSCERSLPAAHWSERSGDVQS